MSEEVATISTTEGEIGSKTQDACIDKCKDKRLKWNPKLERCELIKDVNT